MSSLVSSLHFTRSAYIGVIRKALRFSHSATVYDMNTMMATYLATLMKSRIGIKNLKLSCKGLRFVSCFIHIFLLSRVEISLLLHPLFTYFFLKIIKSELNSKSTLENQKCGTQNSKIRTSEIQKWESKTRNSEVELVNQKQNISKSGIISVIVLISHKRMPKSEIRSTFF